MENGTEKKSINELIEYQTVILGKINNHLDTIKVLMIITFTLSILRSCTLILGMW
jgi:hypothetical protein